jgi:hypothetical protein
MERLIHWFHHHWTCIKRSVRWGRRMYSNHDWDYHFLLQVMEWKLKEMEDLFRGPDAMHVGSELDAKHLMILRNLLTRIRKDEYQTPWDSWFDEWLDQNEDQPCSRMSESTSIKLRRAVKREEELKRYDLELFCRLFHKHLFSFWD